MLKKVDLSKVLFLDIETVPERENFDQLSDYRKELWAQKSACQGKREETPETFYRKAAIWAKFGKIVCISVECFILQKIFETLELKPFLEKRSNCFLILRNYFTRNR